MDMSSNDIVMNNADDITNNDVECTLRNYSSKFLIVKSDRYLMNSTSFN